MQHDVNYRDMKFPDSPFASKSRLHRICGQVWALGQEVVFEYQGQNFVLMVKNLMVLDRKNVQVFQEASVELVT